jgi:hypothetical protein
MSDMDTFNYRARAAQGRRALWGHESMCLEYKEDNGYLKHSDILSIEMT